MESGQLNTAALESQRAALARFDERFPEMAPEQLAQSGEPDWNVIVRWDWNR